MITRREAEQQATQCFQYHVGLYAVTAAAMALLGPSRSFRWIAGTWGTGVALHGAALYAIPQTRELLLRKTAEWMEDRRRALEQTTTRDDRAALVRQHAAQTS